VLSGLDVVRGDENGIRETDPITRAEVATLAYRIHTADVTDAKTNLYHDLSTAAFTDLAPVSAWALGYIGYAHNAQIVKGNGNGAFNPTGNIIGYEVLAMALRAIGYGKNGEFEGAEWQINTATWGRCWTASALLTRPVLTSPLPVAWSSRFSSMPSSTRISRSTTPPMTSTLMPPAPTTPWLCAWV